MRAAGALLRERGDLDAVGVDEIAARAGVAKATLYRYFRSKAALVATVAAEQGVPVAEWQTPDRRAQILDAAMRLVPERGLLATTMEQVADAAGISAATIYWHFGSKDELIIALLERCSPLADVRRVLFDEPAGDPATDLRALARLVLDVIAGRFDVVQTCLAERLNSPRVATHLLQHVAMPVWLTVAQYFEQQVAAGRFRPAPPLPRVFTFAGPILAFTLARRTFGEGFPVDVEQMTRTIVETFVEGAATPAYRAQLHRRSNACEVAP